MAIRLQPATHTLQVTDRLQLAGVEPDATGAYRFVLHAGLAPQVVSPGWHLEPVAADTVDLGSLGLNTSSETAGTTVPLEGWCLVPGEPGETAAEPVVLRYSGTIHHPLATLGEEYQRSFSESVGLIDERGVYLAGTSCWLPAFGDGLITFELEVTGLQPPWDVVSQGERTVHERTDDGSRRAVWRCRQPSEEAYLVAGPWFEYSEPRPRQTGEIAISAFLRQDDPALAARYLEATRRYLQLYQGMLTPFPFPSFALVENFWETGYGMPGFTLLGPRVIRFPWILTSSYPHELLHSWWGNSVYVDYDRGNWCEGLTTYLADHLFAEQRHEGAGYRRATLQKYSDFVSDNNDLPLVRFHSRRSAATAAIGYGKSLMLFHMLRRAVGDEPFLRALSHFHRQHRFTRATFADLAAAFEETTGGQWQDFFQQWTGRAGAPEIEVEEVAVRQVAAGQQRGMGWQVEVTLRQIQEGEPFPVSIPVAVTLQGRREAVWAEVGSCSRNRTCAVVIPCPSRPLRIDVDPGFDVMRRLDPLEVPPALSAVQGAAEPLFVLPAVAPAEELAAWRGLITAWSRPGSEPATVLDSELDEPPAGSAWLLGWHNRFAGEVVDRLAEQGVRWSETGGIVVAGEPVPMAGHSLVLVARSAADPGAALAWVAAGPAAAIPGLARKLPHYNRYSSLVFTGSEPENTGKGQWQPLTSPLVRNLAGDGELAPLHLPQRLPLAELPPLFDSSSLRGTVAALSAPQMEGRGLGSVGFDRATAWVERKLGELGLEPAGEAGFRQSWVEQVAGLGREVQLTNLVARLPGGEPELLQTQPILVLAHLDHLGFGWPDGQEADQGLIHPGADDNASGVAVLLELARRMAAEPRRPRPVLFAVVTGEEAGLLGSRHLLGELTTVQRPLACLNLDTVGRLGDGQLLVLGAESAREWRHIFAGVGYTTGAPVAVVSEPLDASDQTACLAVGVPAVQLFTGPHTDYHRPGDTSDKIDAAGMTTVTEVAYQVASYLAERTEPLTVTIGTEQERPSPEGHSAGGRRVSLGTMPDFTFAGPGVRVQQVLESSAAAAAGIVAGDVITAVAGQEIAGLRDLSRVLQEHEPGDEVRISLRRGEQTLLLSAVLRAR